ncbi:MAG: hypothetical protein WDZ77_02640 [Candidatus Pacearchaeota archaeon]
MAYKKYIKRDGKIYGPYIYHSKRVDGKVISEYKGSKGLGLSLNFKNLKFLLIFLGMFAIIGTLYGTYAFGGITSNAISSSHAEEFLEAQETTLHKEETSTIQKRSSFSPDLTYEERKALENKFGDLSIEVEKSFVKPGFFAIKYEIDGYWVEFNYAENLGKLELEKVIEEDRIKWLKDLSKRVRNQDSESSASEFEQLVFEF